MKIVKKEDKKAFIIYLLVTFVLAYTLQLLGIFSGNMMIYQILVSVCMFAPLFGTWAACGGLKKEKSGIYWGIHFKKNKKILLLVWFLPAMLTFLGAVLYFVIFPYKYDSSCGYLLEGYANLADAEGKISGLEPIWMALIMIVQSVTYAPFVNMFFALGEEAGWRGFMTPMLTKWLGDKKALLVSGIIWAMFHAPLIVLCGYEYGSGYWGEPVLGLLMMCVFTTAFGILCSYFYQKTESIWIPSVLHGALNAAAGCAMIFLKEMPKHYLLGPTPAGLLSGVFLFALALYLLFKKEAKKMEE